MTTDDTRPPDPLAAMYAAVEQAYQDERATCEGNKWSVNSRRFMAGWLHSRGWLLAEPLDAERARHTALVERATGEVMTVVERTFRPYVPHGWMDDMGPGLIAAIRAAIDGEPR